MRAVFEVMGVTDIVGQEPRLVQPLQHGARHARRAEALDHAGRDRGQARQDGRRDLRLSARAGERPCSDKKTVKVKLVQQPRRHARVAPRHGARPGPAQAQQRVDARRHARGARHDQQGRVPGARCSERTAEDNEHGTQHHQAGRRRQARAAPCRPRHRLGPGQDRGPRPQGPEVACRRLPQGRLRRRPDAAAAPPAQARLQVAPAASTTPRSPWPTWSAWARPRSTC